MPSAVTASLHLPAAAAAAALAPPLSDVRAHTPPRCTLLRALLSLSLSDFGHRRDIAVAGIRSWRTPTTLHDAPVRRRRTHAAVSLTTHPHLYPVALCRRSPYSSQEEKAVRRGGSLGRAARRSTFTARQRDTLLWTSCCCCFTRRAGLDVVSGKAHRLAHSVSPSLTTTFFLTIPGDASLDISDLRTCLSSSSFA